jgi:hypothetical protein
MSKFIDAIIDEARESTENETFDNEVGLTEEEIVKFVNQGLNRLHSKIVAQHPQVFVETYEVSCSADQEAYSIPAHKAFLKNKISQVEYSPDSTAANYYPLDATVLKNRDNGSSGDPTHYIRRGGEILLLPTPSSSAGKLRLTYIPKAKQMDKRRGLIKAVTTSGSNITNLEVNYVNGSTVDLAQLTKRTRISVVDKYGNIKMENVLIEGATSSASYDATITVDSSFEFASGETIAVDDYIISGAYATTHLQDEVGPEVERYIQAYVEYKILHRDSSVDSQEMFQVLAEIEADIIAAYAEISDDILMIPEINPDDWL